MTNHDNKNDPPPIEIGYLFTFNAHRVFCVYYKTEQVIISIEKPVTYHGGREIPARCFAEVSMTWADFARFTSCAQRFINDHTDRITS